MADRQHGGASRDESFLTVRAGCSIKLKDGTWWRPGDVIDPNHPEALKHPGKTCYKPRVVAELSGKLKPKEEKGDE